MGSALSKGGQLPTAHSLAYWAYHFGRSAFFMTQGIAGRCLITLMCLRSCAHWAPCVPWRVRADMGPMDLKTVHMHSNQPCSATIPLVPAGPSHVPDDPEVLLCLLAVPCSQ